MVIVRGAEGMSDSASIVRLTIPSEFDMLDFVQLVSDRFCAAGTLDEDRVHWVGVAVRESVINAIKHGNQLDESKHVTVEFALVPGDNPVELVVRVQDEGEGFDPHVLSDPREPDNLLKSSGRGIFFMRSFMDEVDIRPARDGGMEVRMVKKLR